MKRLFNSLWILLLATAGLGLVICFAYLFLFDEELHTSEKSVEDELVADESWIKQVLSSGDLISNQVTYSQKYGQYLYLEKQCNKTLSKFSPKFTKLVLIIIDALRVDFVPSIHNPDYASPRLPYMEQLVKTHGMLHFAYANIVYPPFLTLFIIILFRTGFVEYSLYPDSNLGSSEGHSKWLFAFLYGLHHEFECILIQKGQYCRAAVEKK